ncbi:uncharacterized protein [Choristoneura fumiferana]|uniref:uncharacterized protein n=1 Tax=Choristoneura fumiferana TaxID=7141 RepID=UPI003D15E8BF
MIRTYTRKPPECRYIEGVLGLCRLCLQRAEESIPIFTEDRADICSSLALRIMICVGLELKREDALPNHICLGCYKDLEQYYAFRKKCEVSYQRLKYHIQAIHNKKAVEALTSATEEAIKQIDVDGQIGQEENVNADELELIMESEESYGILQTDSAPVINDVPSDIPVETKETNAKEAPSAQLPGMLTAALIQLGLVSRAGAGPGGLLARAAPPPPRPRRPRPTRAAKEQEGSYQDEQAEENFCLVPEKQNDAQEVSVDGQGEAEIINEVKSKKSGRGWRGRGGAECSWCGRVCASLSALRRHARTHSGERPYACARCPRRFAQKEVMRRHMLVHDEVRPYACAQCPKSFTQRAALALHARAHLPPHERALRLHACPRCPKVFLHCSGLSRHMMSHAGRLFECGACRKQFADRSSVLRHVRRAHAHDDSTVRCPPQS